MSIEKKTFQNVSWLALFKLISQIFSWAITIVVARILVPDDYGLMAMSTIITGYAEMFNELGLGAAIIQKQKITQNELSSVFWFSLLTSILFAASCFVFAYPTAYIFDEPRVIPITKTVSVLFLLTGLQIVPLNLLKKDLNFRTLGLIEMSSVFVSCSGMLLIACYGGGVWTLIGGRIINNTSKLIFCYFSTKWLPRFHFNFKEAKEYIAFGLVVALGGSFHYIFDKSDRFFAGKAWSPLLLGYYSFALQLSRIPTEKIVTLINQVSYATFSRLQNNRDKFNNMYLIIVKLTATIVLPLFVGGFLLADDLINVFLNKKWLPIIFVFKFLCLAQIVTSINAVNNFVHTAQGRPHWRMYFYGLMATFMSISFYFATQNGFNDILVPWFSTYFALCFGWIILSLNKIGISLSNYLRSITVPILGTLMMVMGITLSSEMFGNLYPYGVHRGLMLVVKMCVAAIFYLGFIFIYDKKLFSKVAIMLKS